MSRRKRKPSPQVRRIQDLEARVFELESALAREQQDHKRTRAALFKTQDDAAFARQAAHNEYHARRGVLKSILSPGGN